MKNNESVKLVNDFVENKVSVEEMVSEIVSMKDSPNDIEAVNGELEKNIQLLLDKNLVKS